MLDRIHRRLTTHDMDEIVRQTLFGGYTTSNGYYRLRVGESGSVDRFRVSISMSGCLMPSRDTHPIWDFSATIDSLSETIEHAIDVAEDNILNLCISELLK